MKALDQTKEECDKSEQMSPFETEKMGGNIKYLQVIVIRLKVFWKVKSLGSRKIGFIKKNPIKAVNKSGAAENSGAS